MNFYCFYVLILGMIFIGEAETKLHVKIPEVK